MMLEFKGSDDLYNPADKLADISAPTTEYTKLLHVSSTEVWPGSGAWHPECVTLRLGGTQLIIVSVTEHHGRAVNHATY